MKNQVSCHCITSAELFTELNVRRLDISSIESKKYYKTMEKKELANRVLIHTVVLILEDVLSNNVSFVFPDNKSRIELVSRVLTPDYIDKYGYSYLGQDVRFNHGMYVEVCFCRMKANNIRKSFTIGKELQSLFNTDVLKKKIVSKTFKDYYDQIRETFHTLSDHDLNIILLQGLHGISRLTMRGLDIKLKGKRSIILGKMSDNFRTFYIYHSRKMNAKVAYLRKKHGIEWDGYHYLTLYKEQIAEYLEQKDDSLIILENVYAYKFFEVVDTPMHKHDMILKVKIDGHTKTCHLFESIELLKENIEIIR